MYGLPLLKLVAKMYIRWNSTFGYLDETNQTYIWDWSTLYKVDWKRSPRI